MIEGTQINANFMTHKIKTLLWLLTESLALFFFFSLFNVFVHQNVQYFMFWRLVFESSLSIKSLIQITTYLSASNISFFYVFVLIQRDLINMLSVTYRICYWRELIVTSQNRKVLIVSMTLHISNKTDTWLEHRFDWRYYIICFLSLLVDLIKRYKVIDWMSICDT